MSQNKYKFRFYLNATHFICINGKCSNIHPHTWEIVTTLSKEGDDFIQFTNIEKEIDKYFSKYDGTTLNTIPPFDRVNPTMENIGKVITRDIIELLNKEKWKLDILEISENPTRTFILSKDNFDNIQIEEFLEQITVPMVEEEKKEQTFNYDIDEIRMLGRATKRRKRMREKRRIRNKLFSYMLFILLILIITLLYLNNILNIDIIKNIARNLLSKGGI